jgi:squalene-hopene/tetraprenyl-beta-curcumene cyclase
VENAPDGAFVTAHWRETTEVTETVTDELQQRRGESTAAPSEADDGATDLVFSSKCLSWLLENQRQVVNPLTESRPGGWAWSDAAGALPNTISTAGVLFALARWPQGDSDFPHDRFGSAVRLGLDWLLELQYEDGGWPTFYANDSDSRLEDSGPDVTAHALSALAAWHGVGAAADVSGRIGDAIERGWRYLEAQQRADGQFVPIWFGNEHQPGSDSPVLGTAQVLAACAALNRLDTETARRAARWLILAQHSTGGWGPPRAPRDYSAADKEGFRAWRANETKEKLCSVEETAASVGALLPLVESSQPASIAVSAGFMWLAAAVEQDAHRRPAVIGFYPPKLWYHERLYPVAYAVGAFTRVIDRLAPQPREIASAASR